MTQIIEIASRAVGEQPRRGEILETLGKRSAPHYRVRWEDGHESVFYPPGDVTIRARPDDVRAVERLTAVLRAAGAPFEVIPHRRTTTAESEARALGVQPGAVGKTIVVRAGGRRFRAVVSAAGKVSVRKLADVTGGEPVLLTETELADEFPGYDVGAVPPFDDGDDCTIVDAGLAEEPSVIVEAGSHECSLRLAPRDLILVANAQFADIGDADAHP
jgi:Ala-tRNA(Pro) deacylase